MTRGNAIVAGLFLAAAFCVMTAIHLDAQGAFYDELHQAPAAFHYIGKHPVMFTQVLFDVPTFNMSYSGAIKSGIYGLFLRYVCPHFSVYSWRLLGILLAAAGVFAFYAIAGPSFPVVSALTFALLLLTDITVIVLTRHDWGPVALALAFRLMFLGTWLSIELKRPTAYKYALAGCIVGFAIFEKLSSVVLLVPFCILVLRSRFRRAAWIAAAAGLLVGVMPLLRANMHTYRTSGTLISLSGIAEDKAPTQAFDVLRYAFRYLSLGAGELARHGVLDEFTNSAFTTVEAAMSILLLLIIAAAVLHLPRHSLLRVAGVMAATYILVGIAVFLLPRATYYHHWILGTPFQYCAIALAAPALDSLSKQKTPRAVVYRLVFVVTFAVFVAARLPNVIGVERSMLSGKASAGFDPGFSRLMEIASAKSKDSFFMAADWGTATQLYCGADGSDDTVDEPFWNADPVQAALEMAAKTKKPVLYVVRSGLPQPYAEISARILTTFRNSPDWHEVPLDETFVNLGPIEVHQFRRI